MAPRGNKNALGCTTSGQPEKYLPEYCQQLHEYFHSLTPYTVHDVPHFRNGEQTFIDKKVIANEFPTFERFATNIGVTVRTLQNWCNSHPEFFRVYAQCKEIQKYWLIVNGLNNGYNGKFAEFVAKNITDMRSEPADSNKGQISVNITLPDNFRGSVSLPGQTSKALPGIQDAQISED